MSPKLLRSLDISGAVFFTLALIFCVLMGWDMAAIGSTFAVLAFLQSFIIQDRGGCAFLSFDWWKVAVLAAASLWCFILAVLV